MLRIRHRVNLLDTWIDKVDLAEALRRIDSFIQGGTPQQVVTVNLDFLRLSSEDKSFQDLVNGCGLVVPDGMPLVWGARLLGDPLPARVAGIDLVLECSRLAAERGYRVFLLGAAPGVSDTTAQILKQRYPGLNVVGTHSPASLNPSENDVTVTAIQAAAPDILFVAFGAPWQEQWIQEHIETLGADVCIGVGGAFDMISGRISRAPMWMQQRGLEWFFRFMMEPGRLWKRYFVHDLPVFVRLVASCALGSSHETSSTVLERLAPEIHGGGVDGHVTVGVVTEADPAALVG